ncbi:hypothetical protein TNCV_4441981 [Trichonephila clavipes]|nr:hypothetical protein TNCV_4441981 [Trichonephila clavipes]
MTGVRLAPCHDEFRGSRSDYVRQVCNRHYFTLMEDNAKPYRDNLIDEFLEKEGIRYKDGQSALRTSSLLEYAWDVLGRTTETRNLISESSKA